MKNGIAQITTGQFAEFAGSVVACLPRQGFNAQYYIENPLALRALLKEAFVPKSVAGSDEGITSIKLWWQNFYKKYFKLNLDFSEMNIPNYKPNFDWIIIIPQGLTIEQVLKVIKKKMEVSLYKDGLSDKDVLSSDRDTHNGHYAVRFRKRVEADEENSYLSANDLKNKNISGITFLERLLMELAYYEDVSKHLDTKNMTLCSGSRYVGGDVPTVKWDSYSSHLRISSSFTSWSVHDLRTREVASC